MLLIRDSIAASRYLAALFLALAISAGITGCGSGSATPNPTPTPTPAPTPTPNPSPSVSNISPSSAPAGALAFTLNVSGSGFIPGSMVEWNGSSRTTTFVSSSQLQAHIMSADLASPGKATVTVVNPAPGGGTSAGATFTIAADTIAFQSARALDGSDAANTNNTRNVWMMNADGSGQTPLTKLTALNADSVGPTFSPDGSRILFLSARALDGSDALSTNGIPNVWVMNADGSGQTPLTKLTAPGADSFSPTFSLDGRRIVFLSARALDGSDAGGGSLNVWVMNADGSGQTPLTKLTGPNSDGPAFSPDGSRIVFFSARALDGSDALNTNGTVNVWVMNADGSGQTPLTKLTALSAGSFSPMFSPDGSRIVFFSARALDGSDALSTNITRNVWMMNADGSSQTPLTKLTAFGTACTKAAWSPDGNKILFLSNRDLDGFDLRDSNDIANIWAMNADGSSQTPLTKLAAVGATTLDAVWTPGGRQILFSSSRALNGGDAANTNLTFNIWVMNADGTGQTPLTQLTASGASSNSPRQP